ncbi:hypothetical protein [uncultured Muribaculum sp.]|uniref:hypothetical protein n=1 Tax=uncultured Muribaculum sp. TaxID=1918613 RepID=UPI00260C8250|nr:hypothetical protein [uncultured Muribaculum sp.]
MTKKEKLGLCDWMLVFATAFILASGIQLEATGSRSVVWIWIHVAIGCLFFSNIVWHLYLHFGWKSWIKRLRKQKSLVTRWLAIFALLTLISAIATFIHWIATCVHSPIGGIHGKIGFVFLLFAIGHTVKRIGFFKSAGKPKVAN